MSLKKQALNGIVWTFIQQMSSQGISFIVSIVLARLLLPEEFGLIALISIFITIGSVLIDSGLSQSLIRTIDIDNKDYSTIFFFNILLGITLYIFMYFFAPFISEFYKQPILVNIIRVYCLEFIISSFYLIQYTKLTKEMNFKKQLLISLPSLIIGSILSILLALKGYGVWSLVWGGISKSFILCVQLWIFSPWKPTFAFDKIKIKKHLNFGYKMTITGLIDSFFKDIYIVVIGKFFNPIDVGFYNRAHTLRLLPIKNFTSTINRVTFPLFSKLQNNDSQLKSVYQKIIKMAAFLIAPTVLFMAVLAEPLFRFLLTEKWLPAVPYFQILCFASLLNPISVYNLNIITVKGRSDLFLKISIIKKIFITLFIIIGFQWGLYGLLIIQIPLSIIGFFLNGWYSKMLIGYSSFQQLKDVIIVILVAFISSSLIWYFDNAFFKLYLNDILRLLIGGFIGISFYVLTCYLLKLDALIEFKSIFLKPTK